MHLRNSVELGLVGNFVVAAAAAAVVALYSVDCYGLVEYFETDAIAFAKRYQSYREFLRHKIKTSLNVLKT